MSNADVHNDRLWMKVEYVNDMLFYGRLDNYVVNSEFKYVDRMQLPDEFVISVMYECP